ncbi:MOSC N-terminal beta barrel domain-containing protein [Quadrisphaera sp. KR29]|uniref:MOSC N-terminal beta barrel domain-containing protein n=1 Tax=Quadrisphaera sp. KR29 TaxID=3461391 RepID=UPI004044F0D5
MGPAATGTPVGVVALLRRFPLRSAGGELPGAVRVESAGLRHDRRWQLVDGAGAPLTARALPQLAGLAAWVDEDDGGVGGGGGGALRVRPSAPAGGASPGAPLADGWPAQLAGPGARLLDHLAEGGAAHRDGAAVHLVSAGAASAPDAPAGCDPGERANVVVRLDPARARPGDERGWTGRLLRLGATGPLLEVTRTPRRCLGVYAAVLEPGEVRLGDAVVLLDPSGPARRPGPPAP